MNRTICIIMVFAVYAGGNFYCDAFGQRGPRAKRVYAVSVIPATPHIVRHRYFSGHISNGLHHWFTGKGKRRAK